MAFNTTRVFMSTFTVFSTLVLTSQFGLSQTQPAPNPVVTTFHCVRLGNGFATVAKRGEKTTSPMITWNSTVYGPKYTPQRRCEM